MHFPENMHNNTFSFQYTPKTANKKLHRDLLNSLELKKLFPLLVVMTEINYHKGKNVFVAFQNNVLNMLALKIIASVARFISMLLLYWA